MNDQLKQIGERLKGLREALELSPETVAKQCNVSLQDYLDYENGKKDISISNLNNIAEHYGIELSILMFGEEARMSSYFLTRKGKGLAVERVKAYKYQSLAAGFINKKAEPFLVTVEPKDENTPLNLNSHTGQEFNMVLKGKLEFHIGSKQLILEEGDSIYFDSSKPHGMKALDDKPVDFLAIIF